VTGGGPIEVRGVDNIGVAVRDVDLVAGFFAESFGFEISVLANGAGTRVLIGDQALALFATDATSTRSNVAEGTGPGFDHVSIRVNDVDLLYGDEQLSSVPWLAGPESLPDWGLRVLGFSDPEGNPFYFVSPVGTDDDWDRRRP
jgi:methylmalonyl-CoA/ethylmalonyl-CoA epimerase